MNGTPLDELIDRYFERQLDGAGRAALEAQLQASAEARARFHEAAGVQSLLHQWAETERGRRAAGRDLMRLLLPRGWRRAPGTRLRHGRRRGAAAALAAAAVVLLGAGGVWWLSRAGPAATGGGAAGVARVMHASLVAWDEQSAAPAGGVLAAGTYRMRAGTLRLRMAGGAVVSLAAPAEFRLNSGSELDLPHGKITVRLPRRSARLVVNAPGIRLTDLGTGFGVAIGDDGQSLVSVFEGRVRIDTPGRRAAPFIVGAGQSVATTANGGGQLTGRSYRPQPFNDLWPLTLGIEEASNLVRFLPPGPVRRPLWRHVDASRVYLLPERQTWLLEAPVAVDLAQGGATWPEERRRVELAAGTRVSSFLVFYNPPKAGGGGELPDQSLSGELTFDREIVGVICEADSLSASDEVLGLRGLDYANGVREMRSPEAVETMGASRRGPLAHDVLRLSEDRRSIYFMFNVRPGFDQVRLLLGDE